MKVFLPCKTPTKEPMELAVISNFHHRRSHRDRTQDLSSSDAQRVNHTATDPVNCKDTNYCSKRSNKSKNGKKRLALVIIV